jgi:23S rRNA (adenine2503-C2)-methyltransferase
MNYQKIDSTDTNVSKFVFEGSDIAVESVLYRYGSYRERTVICCSTQCGCSVGCTFCGAGKSFVRNLTASEIIEQVKTVLWHIDCETSEIKKFQIMFMSMGEPFLNYDNVESAIEYLHIDYPNAQLLVSTTLPLYTSEYFKRFVGLSIKIKSIGIQFSIHESNDTERSKLIPANRSRIETIAYSGERWNDDTGRNPFFNYCVHEGNSSEKNVEELLENFDPAVWECTLSVICESDKTMKNAIESKLELISGFSQKMATAGYSVRVFDPIGQDDIGGGCGQLWYFQEWRKKHQQGSV